MEDTFFQRYGSYFHWEQYIFTIIIITYLLNVFLLLLRCILVLPEMLSMIVERFEKENIVGRIYGMVDTRWKDEWKFMEAKFWTPNQIFELLM